MASIAAKFRTPKDGVRTTNRFGYSEYLTWAVVANPGKLLTGAIELQQRAKLSFWDSLMVQAAIDAE